MFHFKQGKRCTIERTRTGLHGLVVVCMCLSVCYYQLEKKCLGGKAVFCCCHGNPAERTWFLADLQKKKKLASTDLRLQTSANTSIVLDSCREIGFKKQHFSSETVWHCDRREDAKNFCEASASKQTRGHLLG